MALNHHNMETHRQRPPWLWVPSLYFSQGIPYVIVMTMSVIMYKRLGLSNTDIALYTSWLNLPWVLKPLWSPIVDLKRTKRFWVVTMQFLIAGALALAAWSVTTRHFLALSLALFLAMAFASATHDIAADGFYMLSMSQHDQSWWVGWRSTFYRAATIVGSGLLVMLAGALESRNVPLDPKLRHDSSTQLVALAGNIPQAWSITLFTVAGLFLMFSFWHSWVLPRPAGDGPVAAGGHLRAEFFATFGAFFQKPGVLMAVGFILLYRFDEAQLGKVISPFLLDGRPKGGLGLTTSQVGLAYGTCGIAALTCGGLLGGFTAAKYGLKTMLPIMAGAMYLPKLVFLFLSFRQPENFPLVCASVAVEQFGYGFGFTAFMLYMLYFADGPRKTAHYAICTGFMALGMMIPGLWSGWLADRLGYRHFFIWVLFSALPGLTMALLLKVDPHFGKK
jgi:MFS transporter, PAT family, beta-lactamase induction signal transducer AmpG